MSLPGKANIIKEYLKKLKKSIHLTDAKDIFLVIAVIILAGVPLIIGLTVKSENIEEPEPVEIILYLSRRGAELFGDDIINDFLLEYEEKNPGIRVYLTPDEPAEQDDSAGQITPDIYIFNEGEYPALIAGSYLAELNAFTNYDSGSRQIAIPLVSFMDLLFYNIDILAAAGFDSPPKTRDEFLSYARAVSGSGVPGLAVSLGRGDRQALSRDIFSWIWAAGNNFWAENGRPSVNTRAIQNDFTFFGALYREGLLAPGVFHITGDQRLEQFSQGRAAMMIASTQAIPYLREKMGDDKFGVTTIPDAVTGAGYGINISAFYAAMSANSAYPEEAWSFLVFLAEKSSFLCAELKAVPGITSSIIPGGYVNNDPFYLKAWGIYEFARIIDSFSEKPGAGEYYDVFLDELEIFFDSTRTPLQTVTAIQQRWNEIFDRMERQ
jgi:multiple sugar transport system substrate-binding protein